MWEGNLLDEAISPAPTLFFLLQLYEFEFAKRFKDIL
jgi:hypothetical protein